MENALKHLEMLIGAHVQHSGHLWAYVTLWLLLPCIIVVFSSWSEFLNYQCFKSIIVILFDK